MLKLKLRYFGHLMRKTYSLEKILMLGKTEGKSRRGWQRMRCLDSITDSMDMYMSKIREMAKDREAWCAAAHEVAKSWLRLGNWTTPPTRTCWWMLLDTCWWISLDMGSTYLVRVLLTTHSSTVTDINYWQLKSNFGENKVSVVPVCHLGHAKSVCQEHLICLTHIV